MKLHRMLLAVAVLAAVAGLAYVAQQAEPSGAKMAGAAAAFLETLTPEQKARATFAFDDKERLNWHFVPLQDKQRKYTRNGLPLEDMNPKQRQAALEMVRAGTSADGYTTATTIMSLEAILHELEKNGAMVRNPEWYFFAVFGTPGKTGKWGWRVEGHHLSLNFTVENGQVISATPAFFGANPATVKAGPKQGQRTIPECEDLARQLFQSLDAEQKKAAQQDKQFDEVEGKSATPSKIAATPVGLSAAKLKPEQKETLVKLIQSYAERMPRDIAQVQLKQVADDGIDSVHFAWAGGAEPGQPHSYRVQGKSFVLEFLNVQGDSGGNPANHIHSAWRSLTGGDFGLMAR